jgi:hypothetical protein
MAKLTIFSNKISDVQEKNLKTWPFVFFEGVKSVMIDYDLQRIDDITLDDKNLSINKPRSNNYVKYTLMIDENVSNSNIERRYSALESSVRGLFWKNVVVEIVFNDRTVYKSKTDV